MSKLGLIITNTNNGYTTIKSVNADGQSWPTVVEDERGLLKNFKHAEGDRRFVYFVSFLEDGCLLAVMRPLENARNGDNTTVWVFIPSKANLSTNDINSILGSVKECLDCNDIAQIEEMLGDAFTKEYAEYEHPFKYKASNSNGGLAYYVVNSNINVYDFLKKRYQPEYPTYKYVFILDEVDGLEIKPEDKSKFVYITKEPKLMCQLLPPGDKLKAQLGAGVRICFKKDGDEFLRPEGGAVGFHVHLVLKRDGFNDQEKDLIVNDEVQKLKEDDFKDISWTKTIDKSQFNVSNKTSRQSIREFNVCINGKPLGRSVCVLKEKELTDALVIVTADGYEKVEQKCDLHKTSISIQLKPKVVTKEYSVLLSDGKTNAKLTWQQDEKRYGAQLTLPEYEIRGKDLVRIPSQKENVRSESSNGSHSKICWRDFFIGVASTLFIVTLLAVAGYFVFFNDVMPLSKVDTGSPEPKESHTVPPSANERSLTSRDNEPEVSSPGHLFDSIVQKDWTLRKADLDTIHDLKGLYDALNNFKFEELRGKWSPLLSKDSEKFKNIIDKIGELEEKSFGSFSTNGEIKIKKYEEKLEELKKKQRTTGTKKGKGDATDNKKPDSTNDVPQGDV